MDKASEGDGIPGELFEVLKDDPVKLLLLECRRPGFDSWVRKTLPRPPPEEGMAAQSSILA